MRVRYRIISRLRDKVRFSNRDHFHYFSSRKSGLNIRALVNFDRENVTYRCGNLGLLGLVLSLQYHCRHIGGDMGSESIPSF